MECASCVWTSGEAPGVVADLDDDTAELIARLCTRFGMTMEDASVVALTIAALDRTEMPAAITKLEAKAPRIAVLAAAAKALSNGN
jgi:hypothetical protein